MAAAQIAPPNYRLFLQSSTRAVGLTVFLTPEAKADIGLAVTWYQERSALTADGFLVAVSVAFRRIEAQPTAHVVVDEETGARRALLRRFPHRVFYLVDGDKAVVFAVTHLRRNDSAWQARLDNL